MRHLWRSTVLAFAAAVGGMVSLPGLLLAQRYPVPPPPPLPTISTPEIDGLAGIAAVAIVASVVAILYRKAAK